MSAGCNATERAQQKSQTCVFGETEQNLTGIKEKYSQPCNGIDDYSHLP